MNHKGDGASGKHDGLEGSVGFVTGAENPYGTPLGSLFANGAYAWPLGNRVA
jgi:hypothetical protein